MNSKERLAAVNRGEKVDRIPFLPTILEYSAGLIGKTPSEVAVNADLLETAQISAYKRFGYDALTIGIGIYNIEAEALGCKVKFYENNSIPGIISHPMAESFNIDDITFSAEKGRIGMILKLRYREHRQYVVRSARIWTVCLGYRSDSFWHSPTEYNRNKEAFGKYKIIS